MAEHQIIRLFCACGSAIFADLTGTIDPKILREWLAIHSREGCKIRSEGYPFELLVFRLFFDKKLKNDSGDEM
jgi:hypothetical protein